MKQQRALISGAGVAGSALAYWFGRAGYETVVVERAPALREGGQAVDFRARSAAVNRCGRKHAASPSTRPDTIPCNLA